MRFNWQPLALLGIVVAARFPAPLVVRIPLYLLGTALMISVFLATTRGRERRWGLACLGVAISAAAVAELTGNVIMRNAMAWLFIAAMAGFLAPTLFLLVRVLYDAVAAIAHTRALLRDIRAYRRPLR